MRVLGRDKLDAFKKKHPQSRVPLNAWLTEAQTANWGQWADIKDRFRSADWLGNGRVVFNIKGNDFRLVVQVFFKQGNVIIERVGTHTEYDKWRL